MQAAVAAFNWNDMEALAALCTEDLETIPFEGWPDDPVYRGRDGIKRLAGGWWETFDGTQIKVERLEEVGERVLGFLLMSGTQQGVKMEQHLGAIFDVRDGLVARMQFFLGYEPAADAVGVSDG